MNKKNKQNMVNILMKSSLFRMFEVFKRSDCSPYIKQEMRLT